jgi:predicted RNA-binding Zn-ribbon protein involved in translation (DUF1610 family)
VSRTGGEGQRCRLGAHQQPAAAEGRALRIQVHVLLECPDCGNVRIDPKTVDLVVEAESREGTQRFPCPSCGQTVSAAVTAATSEMLMVLGARLLAKPAGEPGHVKQPGA